MINKLDGRGGYDMYWNGRLMARLYLDQADNGHVNFYLIPYDTTPEEIEKIFIGESFGDGKSVFIDHLTGVQIPNEDYSIYISFLIHGFHYVWLGIRYNDKKNYDFDFFSHFADGLKYVFSCFKTLSFKRFPKELYRRLFGEFRLEEQINRYLASQETAIIDMRRAALVYWHGAYMKSDDLGIIGDYCPIEKESLRGVKRFALALPAHLRSPNWKNLLESIDPGKVFELTIFDPISLDDFLIYKDIKTLVLFDADNLESLHPVESFTNLERLFISGNSDVLEIKGMDDISKKIQIELAVFEKTDFIVCYTILEPVQRVTDEPKTEDETAKPEEK